jgi:hypothetical protein
MHQITAGNHKDLVAVLSFEFDAAVIIVLILLHEEDKQEI